MPQAHPSRPQDRAGRLQVHEDEILTGEAVALDVQPIGLILRAAGALIDLASLVLLYIALLWVSWELLRVEALPWQASQIVAIVLLVAVFVCVPLIVESLSKGRSLGKLAVGARVVRSDGGAIGFRHAFIRAVLGIFEVLMTIGSVALVVGMFTPRAQRLGDLVAGTYAERTRTPRLPDDTRLLPLGMEGWAAIADVGRVPDRVGRRMSQFVAGAGQMYPPARMRAAADLAAELAPYVSPFPAGDPETVVRAVAAARRDREFRSLVLEQQRVAALTR